MDLNKKNKEPAVRHCWQILWIPGQVIQTFITVKCRWHLGKLVAAHKKKRYGTSVSHPKSTKYYLLPTKKTAWRWAFRKTGRMTCNLFWPRILNIGHEHRKIQWLKSTWPTWTLPKSEYKQESHFCRIICIAECRFYKKKKICNFKSIGVLWLGTVNRLLNCSWHCKQICPVLLQDFKSKQ